MTQDERNMLADLANKISQTPAPPRDPDAEDFIRKNIGGRPDALYLMTQTVLIQNMALQQSQHQIQELQQRLSQPVPSGSGAGSGSFLGQSAPSSYAQSQYQQPQYQVQAPQYVPSPVAPPASGMSGFLRGAAQTAAGVAAGTLAIQGIESLFSHHSGFGGEGLMGGGGISGYGGGETVIENNYYGDPHGSENRFADGGDANADPSVNIGPGSDFQAQDADYDDSPVDNSTDDSSFDDSSDNSDTNFA
jgi:hypothetical protein